MSSSKLIMLLLTTGLFMPAVALAESVPYHPLGSSKSANEPQRLLAAKSREGVKQELFEAQRNGSLFHLNRSGPKVPEMDGMGYTRLEANRDGAREKSPVEIKQEPKGSDRDSSMRRTDRNPQATPTNADPGKSGKTRQEVIDEYLNMSPEEKQRLRDLYPGG